MGPRRSVSMPDGHCLKMWSNKELISLAERMQQGLHVRDRYSPGTCPHDSLVPLGAIVWECCHTTSPEV